MGSLGTEAGSAILFLITLCSDNSKRIQVRRLCPSAEKQQCMLTHPRGLKFCQLQEYRSETQACLVRQQKREETAALVCNRPCVGEATKARAHKLARTATLPL